MPASHLHPTLRHWGSALAFFLDPRSGPRFVHLILNARLASGRGTVTTWVRAAGLAHDFRSAYRTTDPA